MTRLLNIAALLSFAGLLLTCLGWGLTSSRLMPMGFDVPLGWTWTPDEYPRPWTLSFGDGYLFASRTYSEQGLSSIWPCNLKSGLYSRSRILKYAVGPEVRFTSVGAKLWLVAAAFAVLPAVWVATSRRRRRAHRRKQGLCENCGYDLRGSPDGQCPECGVKA